MELPYRLILFHNQATSAWLRFLRFPYHSIMAFKPLPRLSMLIDDHIEHKFSIHPAAIIREAEQQLGLDAGALEYEPGFNQLVDIAGGPVRVLLARFTCIDAPVRWAEGRQFTFIDLNQARDLPQVELELLRKVYELIIGD